MSTGRKLNTISIQLGQLLGQINNKLNAALFKAKKTIDPHEMATSQLAADLNNWQRQLALFGRELARIDNSLDVRERNVRSVPRSQRFRERQSIDSTRNLLDSVEKQAAVVQARLEELTRMVLIPDGVEAINKSFGLINDALKEADELSEMLEKAQQAGTLSGREALQMKTVVSEGRHYLQSAPQVQNAGPDWLLILTLTARIAHMAVLALYNRTKSDKK